MQDVRIHPLAEQLLIDAFHHLVYQKSLEGQPTLRARWLGWEMLKCPLDLWTYQEILFETRPGLIIETGTLAGGSAMYLCSLCDLIGHGRVISIDIKRPDPAPQHPRLQLLTGSSTDPAIVAAVQAQIVPGERVMVILDSDHRAAHVTQELAVYAPLVTSGNYLIVEDTNVSGHPVPNPPGMEDGPGPMEALLEFKGRHPEFAIDLRRERFLLTMNPRGYLLRR